MKDIKLGIIGCGLFGQSIIEAWEGVPYAQVEAICDIDPKTVRAVSKKYRIGKTCTDFRQLCKLPELDAICVVTTEDRHRAPTVAALESGKHVFCEKPFATNLADAEAMMKTAEKTGLNLMIGHLLRFETRYAMAKEEIAAGKIGRIISMQARRNRWKDLYLTYSRQPLFLENSIHDIDLMLWYAKDKVKNVRGFTRQTRKGKNPDVNWGILEFSRGAIACVETTWLLPGESGVLMNDEMQIIGEKGVIDIDISPTGLSLWSNKGFQSYDIGYDSRYRGQANGALLSELSYFGECISKGKTIRLVTPSEAYDALEVALALTKSAKAGKDVKI